VLLGLEATGKGHVQYSRIGSTQHRFSTLKLLAQNKLSPTSIWRKTCNPERALSILQAKGAFPILPRSLENISILEPI
jgi:hypothetical protein